MTLKNGVINSPKFRGHGPMDPYFKGLGDSRRFTPLISCSASASPEKFPGGQRPRPHGAGQRRGGALRAEWRRRVLAALGLATRSERDGVGGKETSRPIFWLAAIRFLSF